MTTEQEKLLIELGTKLHPHLGEDNHTNRLLKQLFSGGEQKQSLTSRDYFDIGKYYDRMLRIAADDKENPKYADYIHALVDLKGEI